MAGHRIRSWVMENRASARVALVMRLVTMALGVITSLGWTRVFVQLLGKQIYGLLLTFQNLMRFAGLGDFGISGALGIRTGQMLGRGEQDRLRDFLASARTLLLFLALVISAGFAALSPWLPGWLGFAETPGAGSLNYLFCAGALLILLNFTGGYFNSINSGCGTVMWPVLPVFLIAQAGQVLQWLVARQHAPLWQMILAQAVVSILCIGLGWWMLRASFPPLSRLNPLGYNPALWRELTTTSGWVCLYVLGSLIFTTTDVLLINFGFGPGTVTGYVFNYKPVEMALQLVVSASYVSQGKLNIWLADPAPGSQSRARAAVRRLCQFQSLAGTACAAGYLALDNLFIAKWVGPQYQGSMVLQWAFALNLAVTTAGDTGIQVAGIFGPRGLRAAGIAIGLCGMLNLVLSFIAMRYAWLAGIAYATVLAQTILSLFLGAYICRQLGIAARPWLAKSWLLPVATVSIMAFLQSRIGSTTWQGVAGLLAAGALLVILQARLVGVTRNFFVQEWQIVRDILRQKGKS
jgi:hypothetical protein